ncbi:MAG: Fic family protein [Ignavibacteria bacterium]|nr:Fic family protein [Ignavibacteria bacterium]
MDIKEFVSGNYKQQYKYKSFSPSFINIDWEVTDFSLVGILSLANNKLGELNAYSRLIPDVDFFIKMHIRKEATQSSRIEGTQTNMEDALKKSENISPEKRDDWEEVQNYISAMNFAVNELSNIPISTRLLKQAHNILLKGTRGKNKQPGEFRKSQNWIGGASLNDATFIPPHHSEINHLMSDLEKFIHNEFNKLPLVLKAGIAHYQFETIHPFLDGNGRIGRLLITLLLIDNGMLTKPSLYLSDFFEKHRQLYYDNLSRARTNNDLTQWLKFFLEGVYQTSNNAIDTFKNIIELKTNVELNRIVKLGKKVKTAQNMLNYLYSQPLVDSGDVVNILGINNSTAARLIDDFINLGILEEITGFKRNRIFIFKEYLNLFEK